MNHHSDTVLTSNGPLPNIGTLENCQVKRSIHCSHKTRMVKTQTKASNLPGGLLLFPSRVATRVTPCRSITWFNHPLQPAGWGPHDMHSATAAARLLTELLGVFFAAGLRPLFQEHLGPELEELRGLNLWGRYMEMPMK